MRARAMLIAAAVAVVALGAGAVLVAGGDDEQPSSNAFSSSEDPSSGAATAPEPAPETTAPAPGEPPQDTAPREQPGAPTTTEQEPPASGGQASRPARKTHFEREPKGAPRNDEPDREFAVPPAHEFTGEGNAHLGTIDVKATSVLRWRTKGRLEVRFGREAFPIIAPTNKGQLVVPPFLFTDVSVVAAGPWRITIRPQ